MRVLIAHNKYRGTGGELVIAQTQAELLRRKGNDVDVFFRSNDEIGEDVSEVSVPFRAFWAQDTATEFSKVVEEFQPDVLHVHNTWVLISPAIYWVAKEHDIAVVQTLHNYRLMCPMGRFLRNGEVCEKCLGKSFAYPGVVHQCYRNSRPQTALAGGVVSAHWAVGTWKTKVDRYIVNTEFARGKFIEGGLPEQKIAVKPNFVEDRGVGEEDNKFALFVGRISEEKGLDIAIQAWRDAKISIPLRIVGDGPMENEVSDSASSLRNVEYLGRQSREEVVRLMKRASFLVFPSIWYEGMPMTILEAFSVGLPVVASDLGAMSTLVEHERTGLHFEPGNPSDLATQVRRVIENPDELQSMSEGARREYELHYTPESNYDQLMQIYEEAIESTATS
ncbi:glycosyltransferase family 4 protein [Salinibacter ruber]|uniref:glycosyltransferase family 4 protein n=1 Tax=Salinibacter ruber TaxID=146919 RepID=UPI000E57741F|nr:glycosyltransferase family 4 protein [Salinibacter ruber]